MYETLILELTKAILKKDMNLKSDITHLIKESFRPGTELYKELKLYHALDKTKQASHSTAEKIMTEVKKSHKTIDKKSLVIEQDDLVRKMKKSLPDNVMNNFVPNYKSLATIYQIFNTRASIKTRIILENTIIDQMRTPLNESQNNKMIPIDNLVYKTFTKKFNQEYSEHLLEEQKKLLSKYVSSFTDNGLELKTYLNEEIKRLKSALSDSLLLNEISSDDDMLNKTKQIISVLESYKTKIPNKEMVRKVIKIQGLAHEMEKDATN